MRRINGWKRAERLIRESAEKLEVNLNGMNILTEAASGYFALTPLMALMSGADRVYAVARDSVYGKREEVIDYVEELRKNLKLECNILYVRDGEEAVEQDDIHIVTNLGFVRPIDRKVIDRLPKDAAVAMMFEAWEKREEDMDYKLCRDRGIPVLATRETDARLGIFKYVGMLAVKLLLESGIEIFTSKIMLLSSGIYEKEIRDLLERNGAWVKSIPTGGSVQWDEEHGKFLADCDAVVLAEQESRQTVIGQEGKSILPAAWIREQDIRLIHISGVVDEAELEKHHLSKYPSKSVSAKQMTVTTDYVGMKPVIDLHMAGLKVGQELVCGMRRYQDAGMAVQYALQNSPAMELP